MPDVRLIDGNAIVEKLKSYYETLSPDVQSELIRRDEVSSCIAELINAPTIDAQMAKHGKWLETHCDLICGVCKWEYSDELPYMSRNGYDSHYEAFAFCPHCGSRLSPPDGAVYEIEDFGGDTDGNGNG